MKKLHRHESYKFSRDNLLLYSILLLLIFGVVMVYDVSIVYAHDVFGGKYYFLFLQSAWVFIGLMGFFIGYKTDYHKISKLSIPVFLFSLFTLILVLLPTPFAPHIYGARRWLYINPEPFPIIPLLGRLGFQPSEFVKLAFILYLATLLTKKEDKSPFTFASLLIVVVGLVMLQPDFGTAMLISAIGVIMYFVSGASVVYFLIGIPIALILVLSVFIVSPHGRQRLLTYFHFGSVDTQGAGYHINQILIALGSGGIFGLGLGQSRQKYQYLPEVATDSIFAVIGEELGFIGLLFLIGVLVFIIYRGFRIAKKAPDSLGKLLATGITSWFAIQCGVNLSAMVHLIPLTGIPLPLISYGGSSMIFTLLGLGILLNVSSQCENI